MLINVNYNVFLVVLILIDDCLYLNINFLFRLKLFINFV